VIVLGSLVLGCSGGASPDRSGVVSGGQQPSVTGSFTADEPNPGADTVSLAQQQVSNDVITLRVNVTDTSGVFGAAFELQYDPSMVSFQTSAPGTLLEQGGQTVTYNVATSSPGRLVVAVQRQGTSASGANAQGTVSLVRLTFRLLGTGTSGIDFMSSPALYDAQATPQPLPGIDWYGGTFAAN